MKVGDLLEPTEYGKKHWYFKTELSRVSYGIVVGKQEERDKTHTYHVRFFSKEEGRAFRLVSRFSTDYVNKLFRKKLNKTND